MPLKIRLSRGGAKKRPFYRIVIADARAPRDGRYIERIGTYNPLLPKDHPTRVTLKPERVKYWLDNGATPTDRVARFLGHAEIIPMPAARNNPNKAKPRPKTVEREKAREEAAKAAAEAPPPEPEAVEEPAAEEAQAAPEPEPEAAPEAAEPEPESEAPEPAEAGAEPEAAAEPEPEPGAASEEAPVEEAPEAPAPDEEAKS